MRCDRQLTARLAAVLLLSVVAASAAAQDRIALVIGNGAYKDSPLANPVNDAADMAEALQRAGFKVILRRNADTREMRQAIREFGTGLRRAKAGLFYFAGHGIQMRGNNYLLPVGVDFQSEADVEDLAVDANYALRTMEESQVEVSIIVLDACRNNPFARSFRSASRGLAQMTAATGSLIAFATAPGATAADGTGRNGVYTKHLLESLKQKDTDILKVFQRTRAGVVKETGGKQTPWETTSLIGDFYFASSPAPAPAQVASAAPPPAPKPVVADVMQPSFNYSAFLRELDAFMRDNGTPVPALRSVADKGDRMGALRWCAVATDERFKLGSLVEDGMQHCRKLAEAGSPVGMFLYSRALQRVAGKPDAMSVAWTKKASDLKFAPAMHAYAGMQFNGRGGVDKDQVAAARLMQEAAEQGYPLAQYGSGVMLMYGGSDLAKDPQRAAPLLLRAAEAGIPEAMVEVGAMYINGVGVPKDEAEGVRWYRKGADAGEPYSLFNLANIYMNGKGGVAKDSAEAARLFERASDAGHRTAKSNLGWLLVTGDGVKKDPQRALQLFREAGEKGELRGYYNMGQMYDRGDLGVPKDVAMAASYYQKVVEGVAPAQLKEAATKALARLNGP